MTRECPEGHVPPNYRKLSVIDEHRLGDRPEEFKGKRTELGQAPTLFLPAKNANEMFFLGMRVFG